jgi:predicted nuclease of predicted toxin-antitoxin system
MKLLFDQNISHKIIALLPEQFALSSSVKGEGLYDCTDREIWEFAKKEGFIIVTQDSDFNDLNILYGFPPKIIWIRTGNLRTVEMLVMLVKYQDDILNFIEDNKLGCFEIVQLTKK